MGRDKAELPLDGEPLATRLARLLAGLVEEVLLVGGEPPPQAPGRRVRDPDGTPCALRGVVGALEAASCESVLVLATDLALVTPDLLLALVAAPRAEAVVPRPPDGPQPLCALYDRKAAAPSARVRLETGRLAVRGWLETLEVRFLESDDLAALDPEGRALFNVNTPEDYSRARDWLAG